MRGPSVNLLCAEVQTGASRRPSTWRREICVLWPMLLVSWSRGLALRSRQSGPNRVRARWPHVAPALAESDAVAGPREIPERSLAGRALGQPREELALQLRHRLLVGWPMRCRLLDVGAYNEKSPSHRRNGCGCGRDFPYLCQHTPPSEAAANLPVSPVRSPKVLYSCGLR